MLENKFYIIAFDSTHYAINTEKKLMGAAPMMMVPTPREISVSCGLSIKIRDQDLESILEALAEVSKEGMSLFRIDRTSKDRKSLKIDWRD